MLIFNPSSVSVSPSVAAPSGAITQTLIILTERVEIASAALVGVKTRQLLLWNASASSSIFIGFNMGEETVPEDYAIEIFPKTMLWLDYLGQIWGVTKLEAELKVTFFVTAGQ